MADTAVQLIAGTVAGATAVLLDYPLDTLKTRMQVLGGGGAAAQLERSCGQPGAGGWLGRPTFYSTGVVWRGAGAWTPRVVCQRGYLECIRGTWRADGLAGFYHGMSVPFMAQGVENALLFTVFSSVQQRVEPFFSARRRARTAAPTAQTTTTRSYCSVAPVQRGELWVAAASAGAAVSLVLTPVEFVKGNMQVSDCRWSRNLSVLHFCRDAYQLRGLRGFYAGFTGTCLRAVPGNTAYFITYKQLLHSLGDGSDGGRPSRMQCVVAGGVSGVMYWSVMYPCDVVKTRMQICAGSVVNRTVANAPGSLGAEPCAHGSAASLGPCSAPCPSFRASMSFTQTLRATYREGGVRALYRGWGVTAARAFLSSAIVFSVYEHVQPMMASAFTPRRHAARSTAREVGTTPLPAQARAEEAAARPARVARPATPHPLTSLGLDGTRCLPDAILW